MAAKHYLITAWDKKFHCKFTSFVSQTGISYTIAVGGKAKYVIFAIKENASQAYIDRIEYDQACVMNGKLEHQPGTQQLVSASLWAVPTLLTQIREFTLTDDSHVFCKEGSKLYKLSIAYDYIIKYGKTWYEDKFSAILPEPLFTQYKESLRILDEPLELFEFQAERLHFLKKHEDTYRSSKSPRDFIQNLRNKYGEQYCYEVGPWLSKYMEHLQVKIYKDQWKIPVGAPQNFSMREIPEPVYGGGGGGGSGSRRKTAKVRNFSLRSSESESMVGYY